MATDLPESQVVRLWQRCQGRHDLVTEEAGPVNVIYPGRANDGGGADFRDAVIQTEYGLITGDIEIHSRASDWWAHGHHRDPVYNRVVLHVAFRCDTAGPVMLQNGRTVPTLALARFLASGRRQRQTPPAVPCQRPDGQRDAGKTLAILDAAGEQRFQSRVAGFQAAPAAAEAGQALYRGIMGALGYTANKFAMMELACRLPLCVLETPGMTGLADSQYLARCQAMLLGGAGLLPSQRAGGRPPDADRRWLGRLEKVWQTVQGKTVMSVRDWRFFRVRPDNFPDRRLMAMGRLLCHYRRAGLFDGLMGVLARLPAGAAYRQLEAALIVGPENGGRGIAALGRDRAAAIVINVLLPFALARGRRHADAALAARVRELYHGYPALATNTIDRHMCRQLGLDLKLVNTARRQQGLLHIFKTWCALGRCADCPLPEQAAKGAPPARSGCVFSGSR